MRSTGSLGPPRVVALDGLRCVFVFAAMFVASASGCGPDDRVIREWRADDHAEPGGGEPTGQVAPGGEPGGGPGGGGPGGGGPGGGGPGAEPAGTPEEQEARAVAALFGVSCASCHGSLGVGDGPSRPPGPPLASFADAAWQASRTDEQLADVIVNGRGTMPAFGTQVNPRGVAALVRHIRLLGGVAPAPSAPAAGPSATPAPPATP